MSILERIREHLAVAEVLAYFDIPITGRKRIPCPIHGGNGSNFCLSSDGQWWTCFSRHCGSGHRRDAINLYCLLEYGSPLPLLDNRDKFQAINQLATLAGLEMDKTALPKHQPVSRWERIPELERQALAEIFADTENLKDLGRSSLYSSREAQNCLLFLAIAKSLGKLPRRITTDWSENKAMIEFMKENWRGRQ